MNMYMNHNWILTEASAHSLNVPHATFDLQDKNNSLKLKVIYEHQYQHQLICETYLVFLPVVAYDDGHYDDSYQ